MGVEKNPEQLIRCLIKGTIYRALVESIACAVVIGFFGYVLQTVETRSPTYYGSLLILIAAGFIIGVVWSHALSYRLLREHSASDTEFWRAAFQTQIRLLRLVPLWYVAPIGLGGLVFTAPTQTYDLLAYPLVLLVFTLICGAVIWLNRVAAAQLERQAAQLS